MTEVLDRVRRGIFPAPRRLRWAIDPALEAICLKAMALRPEERFGSPLALAGEIEAWLADVRYRGDHVRALNEVKGSLSRLCIERAQNLFGREMHDEGMLWLARAMENLPADSPDLERVVRSSLGSWHARSKLMERSVNHGGEIHAVAFSPDGMILATASRDRTTRLWDTGTGLPIGPPLEHRGNVHSVSFSADGRRLATGSADGLARFWRVAPQIPGNVERISCWVRVTTDLDFDSGDAIRKLDPLIGWELRRRLHELGGPPPRKIER